MKPGGMILLPKPGTFDQIMLIPVGASFRTSPLGAFFLPILKNYCDAFYHPLPVTVWDGGVSLKGVARRQNDFDDKQYLIGDIFAAVNKATARSHGTYIRLAVTLEDIYPGEEWNFVYGQARTQERVGVFSFARHTKGFYDGVKASAVERGDDVTKQLRCCMKTMVHEIGHMFNLRHCVYFHCLMNGNNGEGESAGSGLGGWFMCPVCERKLKHTLDIGAGRNVGQRERFERMGQALRDVKEMVVEWGSEAKGVTRIEKDVRWLEQRVKSLDGELERYCGECADEGAEERAETDAARGVAVTVARVEGWRAVKAFVDEAKGAVEFTFTGALDRLTSDVSLDLSKVASEFGSVFPTMHDVVQSRKERNQLFRRRVGVTVGGEGACEIAYLDLVLYFAKSVLTTPVEIDHGRRERVQTLLRNVIDAKDTQDRVRRDAVEISVDFGMCKIRQEYL